ncbi:unnamed protein product [marine sediment metagenome]|uniref:Uncharacterized protein n=1 Tax=marine sediment metagenome TaxID=412755 RepID=X1CXQ9_9ZZZZ
MTLSWLRGGNPPYLPLTLENQILIVIALLGMLWVLIHLMKDCFLKPEQRIKTSEKTEEAET